jgi:signal recognition particle subunit SRP68
VHHAEQLVTLLESESLSSDVATRLEARAYKATLAGQSAFERKQWQTALKEYSIAKVILEALIFKADESTKSVYKDASAAVDPGLRYCGYQLQLAVHSDIFTLARTHLPQDPTLIALLKDFAPEILEPRRNSTAAAGITSVQWRSRTATLDHPEIVVSLLKVQDTQTAFHERTATFDLSATERAAALDDTLNAWAEAEDTVRRVIDEGIATKQDKEQKLQVILTYVSFHFIATRVQRDVLLVKDLEKRRAVKMTVLKDLVRLHDSIIQVCNVRRR